MNVLCGVVDIPINIHHAVWNQGTGKLSIGVGSSNNLMLTELYNYYSRSYSTVSKTI
jgi:hypothetical protein